MRRVLAFLIIVDVLDRSNIANALFGGTDRSAPCQLAFLTRFLLPGK